MYQYLIGDAILPILLLAIYLKRKKRRCYGEDDFIYTAIGDSITDGIGCRIFKGFSYRIYETLKYKMKNLIYENLGKPGITSYELLKQLKRNPWIKYTLKNSHIITITIGGNNILKSARENYRLINKEIAANGVIEFQKDWPRILYTIRYIIKSDAEIYVMNLYHPYEKDDYNYQIADYFINKINEEIENEELVEKYCYRVIDAYTHFKDKNSWTGFDNILRNPHPNYEGHKQIANLFEDAIFTFTNYEEL